MTNDIKTILIIEDNKLNLKLIRTILLISNFKVLEAENAEEGFQILEDYRPDIILMDIQLPGMDGLTATQRIKESEKYKDIPVIALTAKAMAGDEQKALDAGCDGYIVKPINTQGFISTLTSSLNEDNVFIDRKKTVSNDLKESNIQDKEALPAIKHRIKSINDVSMKNRRILIVDDDRLNVKFLVNKLSQYSYDVLCAYCGEDAIDIVKKELPDLIILDIMMPGIDGFEVIRVIRSDKQTADIPIILITVLDNKEEKIRGLNIGADEFLNKPVVFEELLARVRSLIRLKTYHEQIKGLESIKQSFLPPDCSIKSVSENDRDNSILLIQKDETEDEALKDWIKETHFSIIITNDILEAVSIIKNKKIIIALVENNVPNQDLLYLCQHKKNNPGIKNLQIVIFVSESELNEYISNDSLCSDDFVVKPFKTTELNARLTGIIKKKKRMDSLSNRFGNALHSAMTDPLTTLYNNNYFIHFLEREVLRLKRHKTPLSVIMFEIDDFNSFKNKNGHIITDIIIKDTAQIVKDSIREVDMGSRLDENKFAVILPYTDEYGAALVADRLKDLIDNNIFHYTGIEVNYHIKISVAIVTYLSSATDTISIIQMLENLMDEARKKGVKHITIKNID